MSRLSPCFHRRALILAGLAAFSAFTPAFAGQKRGTFTASAQKEEKHTRLGDVKIDLFDRVKGDANFSSVRITGTRTLIEVPYKRSNSILKVHADLIETKREKDDYFAQTDLTGNVRYTITQKLPDGKVRTVEGTALKAHFRRATQQLELENTVNATVTDSERLSGPGTIRAGKATVDLAKTPYLYTLSGSPIVNDIRFTPREDAAPKNETKSTKRIQPGEVHIHGYETGTFQTGQRAHFEGPDMQIEMLDREAKSQASLHAQTFDASFTEEKARLSRATATGDVRYHVVRPGTDGKSEETLEGRSREAIYEQEAERLTLNGNIRATLLAPEMLNGPSKLVAEKVIVRTTAPYHYEVTANPKTASLTFTPLTAKAPTPKPGEPPVATRFAFGNVTVTHFDGGTFEPGKTARFSGNKIVFVSDDPKSRSFARLLAKTVTTEFSQDRSVRQALAEGEVEFHIRQAQPPAPRAATARAAQPGAAPTIEGTAKTVAYVSAEKSREVIVNGPFQANVNDPVNLEKPGVITGKEGDKITLNLAITPYEFDIESENGTATVDFVPKDTTKDKPETPEKRAQK